MKRLYATTDPAEAELLRALLRDAGIESTLDNEYGAPYAIGLPTAAVPLGINVGDSDAAQAAEILAGHFEKTEPADLVPDPDAPPPPSTEESAAFEERVHRNSAKWRFRLALVYLLPGAITALVLAFLGEWTGAAFSGGATAGLIALGWFVQLLLESRSEKNGPASP